MNIKYDAVVAAGATQYYGDMVVSNLRYDDGSKVSVKSYLKMTFNAPAAVTGTDIYATVQPWVGTSATAESTAIGTNLYSVTATITFASPHTMGSTDNITIGINGDLTQNANTYLQSFVIAADQEPNVNGTVTVNCAAAPDPALQSIAPQITFIRGSQQTVVPLTYGKATSVTLPQGDYQVTGSNVQTSDLTVIAPLVIAPTTFSLATGGSTTVNVTFGTVQRSSALDIAIGNLSGLETATLNVAVTDTSSGKTLASFSSPTNKTTKLRQLPASGTASIKIDPINLNNNTYAFNVPNVKLEGTLQTVTVSDAQVTRTPANTTGFVSVPISVSTDTTLPQQITVTLSSSAMSYARTISVETYKTDFGMPVKPGNYSVSAPPFLVSGTVYVPNAPAQFTVPTGGGATLSVAIEKSANLNVKGFPSFMSFGGCVDLTPNNGADVIAARASAIFVYAGFDGAGDANQYLTDDTNTRSLIALARSVETSLPGQTVLPVPISYTCNLSLGDTPTILANADAHAHSFANYILALNIANSNSAGHPVPAGFIVNPDFLGACQQGGFGATYKMPVRAPLQTALDHWSVKNTIPNSITEDIKGYVAAVNWLTRTVAPSVTFGWQVNLWGVGASEWIYNSGTEPADNAKLTADYITSLGVYSGDNKPDFLAIDRYEADDFTQRGYLNGYCYGPREWQRFFDFVQGLSRALKLPVMPWQIPASHIPTTSDQVNADFDSQHWGTGGSCILGDSAIGTDYRNVNPTLLAFTFPTNWQPYYGGATVQDMFIRDTPFDISQPLYGDFPLRGIFSMLLGGGSTTGIVSSIGDPSPWVRNKLNAYMNAPIPLGATVPKRTG
ncbi:hypothetical protein [Caballeronia sp. BR00000012568055]|uniref:hypothetical protein n=1 Tax=Caballeronia sp. BR00000012568055 TaxID=2918761 RepID=UPI0023F88F20|nr:hypothetical protein [Caballeronia sp. BR00000012568055]